MKTCNNCGKVAAQPDGHCASETCPWWVCPGCGKINDNKGHYKSKEYQP